MEQAIEHGSYRRRIAEQLAPVFHRTIRSHNCTGALVATHDDLQQIFSRGQRQFAHPEIIEDEQRQRHYPLHKLSAGAIESSVGEFVKQRVCLAVEHLVALLDDGLTNDASLVSGADAHAVAGPFWDR